MTEEEKELDKDQLRLFEDDKYFEKKCDEIDREFTAWLDRNPDLLEKPIKELLGDAFFDGFLTAEKNLQIDRAKTLDK